MDIRNFCIIAHIDHGKSTLADRFLEMTNTIHKLSGSQMLDTMDLEQERGITIKLTPARMKRKGVELNLIDTPGHVDFQYEVSRSLAAVEGAVLLVDASQGIQAQTLSTLYMALDNDLMIIPVLNKIDLPAADPARVAAEIEHVIGISQDEVIAISAKTGMHVESVLDAVVERIAAPRDFLASHPKKYRNLGEVQQEAAVARALIFDSVFDQYRGVVTYVKVVNGSFKAGDQVQLLHSRTWFVIQEVGYFTPRYNKDALLREGQIGYIVTGQKSVRDAQIGDTILGGVPDVKRKTYEELLPYRIPGFQKIKPYVFAWVYPLESDNYDKLKSSFEKLTLNDSAVSYTNEHSHAMGHGFRCGFLGMLHMDIIKERLAREYDVETLFTVPTVTYLVKVKNLKHDHIASQINIRDLVYSGLYLHVLQYLKEKGASEEKIEAERLLEKVTKLKGQDELLIEALSIFLKPWLAVSAGGDMPEQGMIEDILEPLVRVEVVGPEERSGNIMSLCQEYRGVMKGMEYLDAQRVIRTYEMPMGEIIVDFYDRLKSATKGYATMNYEFAGYRSDELVRLDIYINGEIVEAFSLIVHHEKSYTTGKDIVEKLKDLIPKHMFSIPLQAGIGSKMIARETIPAMRKDVIAKCYGWDVSRKKKLLQKQKEGKKKMKMMGRVSVPGDVFIKMVAR